MDDREDRTSPDGPDRPARTFDFNQASLSRLEDYWLGGKDHFAFDRKISQAFEASLAAVSLIVHDNLNVRRRAARWLAREAEIEQFIEIGTLLPKEDGDLHHEAQAIRPGAHVVYASDDPQVIIRGRTLPTDTVTTAMVEGSVCDADAIFGHQHTRELIDPNRPFAVIVNSGLTYVMDDDAADAAMRRLRAHLRSGCYLFLTNLLDDDDPRAPVAETITREQGLPARLRPWALLRDYFTGMEMVEPGLVYANEWKPDGLTPTTNDVTTFLAAGMARMP